jgi:NADH dehydrogenase
MTERQLLILGGSGFVGRSLCAQLVGRGGAAEGGIVVPTRNVARAKALNTLPGVTLVPADVHDDAQLQALVRGCDAVVNLVAILHGGERQFEHVHVELPRRLAAACQAAGVRRVVHVSALGAAADAPSRYLRSKAAGEAVLQQAAGLDLTLLRPSVMFGAGDRFLNMFAKLQALFPLMPLAAAHAQFQPVWVEDVAAALVRCLDSPQTIGLTLECTGPRVYELHELVKMAGRWSGHPRPVFSLPDGLARVQAALLGLLPGEPLMSADNLDSMKVPNVASDRLPGLPSLGIAPTSLEAVAPTYLGAAPNQTHLDRWRAQARH